MSTGILYSRKPEISNYFSLTQVAESLHQVFQHSERCSPHGLCMQCHYHQLRLTLEILAALHVPRDSEIWIWGLQFKLLSSGEAQKIPRMCLGPVSSHQTLPPYSSSLCRARGLPNPCGRPGTLSVSKQVVVQIIRDFWFICPLQLGS